MVSKQPVMISFDSSIDGGMAAVFNAAADMYLSKGDNGECGGMLPLEDVVALLSDPSDIIDFVSSPEYSAESVVESPVSDRGGETIGEDASEPGGDIESLDDDNDFALSRALEISTLASAEDSALGKALDVAGPSHRPQNKPLSPCASFSSSSSIRRIFSSLSSSFEIFSFPIEDSLDLQGDFSAAKSSATECE
jgi:hypothetical protein